MASLADFTQLRDRAVMIGMLSRAVGVEALEQWIGQSERALAVGGLLDPTLLIRAGDELERQLRFMRAFLAFRREVEALAADARAGEVWDGAKAHSVGAGGGGCTE